jgi:hypothetical protein
MAAAAEFGFNVAELRAFRTAGRRSINIAVDSLNRDERPTPDDNDELSCEVILMRERASESDSFDEEELAECYIRCHEDYALGADA